MKFVKWIKRGNGCHKDLTGVMSNTGFGKLTIFKNGFEVGLPQKALFQNGSLKASYKKLLAKISNDTVSIEDANWLESQGGYLTKYRTELKMEM